MGNRAGIFNCGCLIQIKKEVSVKYFWPDIQDTKDAHKACGTAAGMAFFMAAGTGVITWLQVSGKINMFPGMSNIAYVDVGLFILIGAGLLFHSRIAALAGLLLFCVERAMMIKSYGFQPSQIISMIIFGLAFVNGVRGAFVWHDCKRAEKGEGSEVLIKEESENLDAKKFPVSPGIILLAVVGIAVAAGYFYLQAHKEIKLADLFKFKTKIVTKRPVSKKPMVAPTGPTMELKLKNGRSFQGILTKKNEEGYWLYIEGMDVVYFSMSEVDSVAEIAK